MFVDKAEVVDKADDAWECFVKGLKFLSLRRHLLWAANSLMEWLSITTIIRHSNINIAGPGTIQSMIFINIQAPNAMDISNKRFRII
jgi:hypothetical protein